MSAAFIVDCSLAMTWLFADEATPRTAKLMQRLDAEVALVPGLFFQEVANVLAIAERKGRVTAAQAELFVAEFSKLQWEVDVEAPQRAIDRLLPLCRQHQLTSYDATYLELAIRRKTPLATIDEPLRKAAKKSGVKLVTL
jgi:predicted nucleic acid-binding protein